MLALMVVINNSSNGDSHSSGSTRMTSMMWRMITAVFTTSGSSETTPWVA